MPRTGAEPSATAVAELVDVMLRAGRTPRLEFLPGAAPAAETALCAGGFAVQLRVYQRAGFAPTEEMLHLVHERQG